MYESFFGLSENPFSIAPDPRYLYMSERHQEALAHLLYGLEREGGVVLLTGEVGTGKTTICRKFLQNVPDNTKLAFVLYPKLSAIELLATIADELGIDYKPDFSTKQLVDLINHHLLAAHSQGKHTALIIDEAQNLTTEVLEQLRLLTNLETDKKKLLQIILLGQPELNELLQRKELRQLSQRVTARYHLEPLSVGEVDAYIKSRLSVAGCQRPLFNKLSLRRIHNASRGIPRIINLICDRSLLGAYSLGEQNISNHVVTKATKEVLGQSYQHRFPLPSWWAMTASVGVVFFALAGIYAVNPSWAENLHFNINGLFAAPTGEAQTNEIPMTTDNDGRLNQSESATTVALPLNTLPGLADVTAKETVVVNAKDETAVFSNNNYQPFENYSLRSINIHQAYQSLFKEWGLAAAGELMTESGNCNWVAQKGFECLHRAGNWRSLLKLNRPAVLTLINQSGVRFRVTLAEMADDQSATLKLDGQAHVVPLETLDRYWLGQYSLIWKVPPYKSRLIDPGAIQDRHEWLAQQLDLRDSLLNIASSDRTANMTQRVKHFQQSVGIQPDGIPGTITIIMLNSWTEPAVPLLMAKDKS